LVFSFKFVAEAKINGKTHKYVAIKDTNRLRTNLLDFFWH